MKCEVIRAFDVRYGRECGKPATLRIRSGCKHEHINEKVVCDDHDLTKQHCRICFLIDNHLCLLLVDSKPLSSKLELDREKAANV